MALNKKILLLYIFLTFPCFFYAQQYPITHYTRDRGLPGNQVWDIFQDSKGYMWFATSAGLIKYNGKEYKIFGKKDGLLNDWPLGLTENNDSTLWVSSERGVSALYGDSVHSWYLYDTEDRIKLFTDSYNKVWVYSTLFPADIFYFFEDSLHNFSVEKNFKNQTILNIAEDREGGIYFLARNGKLYKYFAEDISEIRIKNFQSANVNYVFIDSKNNLIICAAGGVGMVNLDEPGFNSEINWLIKIPVKYGFQSRRGNYWFVSIENGLLRVNQTDSAESQNLLHISEKNGLLSNDVKMIFEDMENNLWIGYDLKGVSKISTLMFYKYDNREGLDANAVFSISKQNDFFICTTEKGIFKLKDFQFARISSPVKYSKLWYTCLLPFNENEMLVGAAPGLYKLIGNSTIKYIGLDNKIVQTILKDHSGRIWIGTHQGLFTFERNALLEQDYDVKDRSIFKLVESGNKDLYIGTDKGLFIAENALSNSGRKSSFRPEKLGKDLSEFISDLVVDSEGSVIVAARNGLNVITKNRLSYRVEELNNTEIISLMVDSKNNLWAGTTRGVYELHKVESTYKVVKRYSKNEGLASDEFSFNGTIYEDVDGKIYFGMFGGISVYNPSEDYSLSKKPKIYINSVEINDKIINPYTDKKLDLSYSQNKISFRCEGLSFFNEDAVMFEYYLYPVEKVWSNSTSIPAISYAYLEPGNYTFFVRVVNQFGITSDELFINFTLSPPFWKSTWFMVLSVIFLVFTGYGVNYYRQKKIMIRNRQLETIVKEKTKDLEISKSQIEDQYLQLKEAQKELVEKRELEKAHFEIQLLKERLAKENIYLREKQGIIQEVSSIIGRSKAIHEVRKKIIEIAGTNSTVLVTGSTGVGKNLVAEAIHDLSPRKARALITVNCAAIPSSLVESELFGYEKGAFTGAQEKHEGKFEVADGSTIFLDEIGDMPLPVQAKLLNVLQSKKFTRIGGTKEITVDVRIIAATNHDLSNLVEQGKFRKDLYYRINVYSIHIPELKERKEDIEPIAKYFVGRYTRILNKKITAITKSALNTLLDYSYPGNIRELENIIHRAVIICKTNSLSDEDILISTSPGQVKIDGNGFEELISLEEMERLYILKVLEKTNWKIRGEGGAAEILKMDPGTLRSRMKKLSIPFLSEKRL